MGKGDKKSRRGKIILGTYGVRRPRKKNNISFIPAKKEKVIKPLKQEIQPDVVPSIEVETNTVVAEVVNETIQTIKEPKTVKKTTTKEKDAAKTTTAKKEKTEEKKTKTVKTTAKKEVSEKKSSAKSSVPKPVKDKEKKTSTSEAKKTTKKAPAKTKK